MLSSRKVQPSGPVGAKILIIGESPGLDDDRTGIPFQGEAGRMLDHLLTIGRDNCRVTNICNYRSRSNDFSSIIRDHYSAIQEGVKEVDEYIGQYPPNIIIILGGFALQFITGLSGIERHRGYLTQYKGIKVLPTYHPARILYTPQEYGIFELDIKKAIFHSANKDFKYTPRSYTIVHDFTTAISAVAEIRKSKEVTVDIESTKKEHTLLCTGFATSPYAAYVFPHNETNAVFVADLLKDPELGKIFHNGYAFDVPFLLDHGIHVNNFIHDTIIQAHVLFPELPRSLEFLTSLYSDEPYYKKAGRGNIPEDTKVWGVGTNMDDLYIYNAKDCVATYECYLGMKEEIEQDSCFQHTYEFEMASVPMAMAIGNQGLLIDIERRDTMEDAVSKEMRILNMLVNSYFQQGFNLNANAQLCTMLYDKMGLPPRMKQNTKGISTRTADKDAVAGSIAYVKSKLNSMLTESGKLSWDNKLAILRFIAKWKALAKLHSSYLTFTISPDGTAKSIYKIPGTDTGRWGCSMRFDEGLNAQTFPRSSVVINRETE